MPPTKIPALKAPHNPDWKKQPSKKPKFVSVASFAIEEIRNDPENLYCHAYPLGKSRCKKKCKPDSHQFTDALDIIRDDSLSLPYDYGEALAISYLLLCPTHWRDGIYITAFLGDCLSHQPSHHKKSTANPFSGQDHQLLRVPKDGPPLGQFLKYRDQMLALATAQEAQELGSDARHHAERTFSRSGSSNEALLAHEVPPTAEPHDRETSTAGPDLRSGETLVSALSAIAALSMDRYGKFSCLAIDASEKQCDRGLLPELVETARGLLGANFKSPPLLSSLDEVLHCLLCSDHRNDFWLSAYRREWAPSFIDDTGRPTLLISDRSAPDAEDSDPSAKALRDETTPRAETPTSGSADAEQDRSHDSPSRTSILNEALATPEKPLRPSSAEPRLGSLFPADGGDQHRESISSSALASQRASLASLFPASTSRSDVSGESSKMFYFGTPPPGKPSAASSPPAWSPTPPGKPFHLETSVPSRLRASSSSPRQNPSPNAREQRGKPRMRSHGSRPKLVGESHFFGEPGVESMLSDAERRLLSDIRAIQTGNGVVPQSLKALAKSHRLGQSLKGRHFSKASAEEDNDGDDDAAWALQQEELVEWTRVCELQGAALECKKAKLFEAAWNAEVHSTVLRLALQGKRREESGVWYRDITTARTMKSRLLVQKEGEEQSPDGDEQASGSKMVDYAIIIEPPAHLRRSVRETARLHGDWSINHTAQDHVLHSPIAVSIETKRSAIEEDEAEVQLSNWVSAHFAHLRKLLKGFFAEHNVHGIPALPLILTQGDVWKLCMAKSDSSQQLHIIKYEIIGTTETVLGIYKLIASLRRLSKWASEDYWPWFVARVLEGGR